MEKKRHIDFREMKWDYFLKPEVIQRFREEEGLWLTPREFAILEYVNEEFTLDEFIEDAPFKVVKSDIEFFKEESTGLKEARKTNPDCRIGVYGWND